MKYFYTKHKKIKGFARLVDFGFVFEIVKDNFCRLFSKIDKSITLDYSKSKTVKISKPKFTTGFTLIELLTVIAIIGFISVIVYANLQEARKRAQATKIVEEVNQLSKSFELYKTDKGEYPGESISTIWGNGIEYHDSTAMKYLNETLVISKYIPVIPQYGNSHSYIAGDLLKSDEQQGIPPIKCGGKIVSDYLFTFDFDDKNFTLDFSRLDLETEDLNIDPMLSGYCIGQ